MQVSKLESRPLYGIGTVARLAGIKPDTLRMWERRYGLGASQKSATGRRQYTQTDLEHLQIISRLVNDGYRIGEIAPMQRKTLDAMLDKSGGGNREQAQGRPTITFVGSSLCDWVEDHPGIFSQMDCTLVRADLEESLDTSEEPLEQTQLLVLDVPGLNQARVEDIVALRDRVRAAAVLVFYQFSSQPVLTRLAELDISVDTQPLSVEKIAAGMRWLMASLERQRGNADAGDLVAPQPRLFSDKELVQLGAVEPVVDCGCNQHLSAIVQTVANFEEYSKSCSVESWQTAATHACVYAYANQARWLLEKALAAVLEEHEQHAEAS